MSNRFWKLKKLFLLKSCTVLIVTNQKFESGKLQFLEEHRHGVIVLKVIFLPFLFGNY